MSKELIENQRPEGWKKGIKPNNKKTYTTDDLNHMFEAGASALIKAGYRLPSTANREAVANKLREWIGEDFTYQGYDIGYAKNVYVLTDQILSLMPKVMRR